MKTGKAVLGVVAGIAAGAVLGAVLANRGTIRKSISKKGEALVDAINDRMEGKFKEFLGRSKDKANSSKEPVG